MAVLAKQAEQQLPCMLCAPAGHDNSGHFILPLYNVVPHQAALDSTQAFALVMADSSSADPLGCTC